MPLGGGAGTNAGDIWLENTSGSKCVITWRDTETHVDGCPATFSVTLCDDGTIRYAYDFRVNNEGSTDRR